MQIVLTKNDGNSHAIVSIEEDIDAFKTAIYALMHMTFPELHGNKLKEIKEILDAYDKFKENS